MTTIAEFEGALDLSVATLGAAVDRDWSVRAGTLTWSCWKTLDHLVDVLFSYAFQIAARTEADVLPFQELHASVDASPVGLVGGLRAAGNLFAAIVRATPDDAEVTWMGEKVPLAAWPERSTRELVLHTYDIATGLGIDFTPAIADWPGFVRESGRPFDAEELAAWAAAAAERRAVPPPAGSEDGLVSDFNDGTMATRFGTGWTPATDKSFGGSSTAELSVVDNALRVSGEIGSAAGWNWAGVAFRAGPTKAETANLSGKRAVSFLARGDRRPCAVWALSGAGLEGRAQFTPSDRWTPYSFALGDLGTDGSDLSAILFAAEGSPGPFTLELDDVRFD